MILRSSKREFLCADLDTKEEFLAQALGNLLKGEENLVVGDRVTIDDEGSIIARDERSSEIFRVLVRESKKKVTAANCDLLLIVTAVSLPEYKRGIIDRFLVRAYQWGIRPVVVFNKMDEYDESQMDLRFEAARLENFGVECFEISALDASLQPKYLEKGAEHLLAKLKNKTSIFLGQSGVGKSSLINRLASQEIDLRTQEIGKAGKGSHTTTWSEIIDCGDFYLIDSPGIRSLSLDDIDPEDLISYFPDLQEVASLCKFTNCLHEESSVGCAFNALEPSELKSQYLMSRLENYMRIRQEVSETPFWAKKVRST